MAATWDSLPEVFRDHTAKSWAENGFSPSSQDQALIAASLERLYGSTSEINRAFNTIDPNIPILDEGRDFPPDTEPCSVFAKGDLRIFFCEEPFPVPGLISVWFGRTLDPQHKGDRRGCIHWLPADFDLKVLDPRGAWVEMNRPHRYFGGTRIRVTYDSGFGRRRTQEVIVPFLPDPGIDDVALLVNNNA